MLQRRVSSSWALLPLPLVVAGIASGCPADDNTTDPDAHKTVVTPIDEPDAGSPDTRDAGPLPCEEDAREDNDEAGTATIATAGQALAAHFCGDDDDWYALQVEEGCAFTARVVQDASDGGTGDLDLVVTDPAGAIVGTAQGLGDEMRVRVRAATSGRYAVRVRGGARDDLDYSITLDHVCAADVACPADDDLEDNDTPATATPAFAGAATDAAACGADVDWWKLPVRAGCTARVHVAFGDHDNAAADDLDIFLFEADGTTALGNSRGTDDDEDVEELVSTDGPLLRVELFQGDSNAALAQAGNDYAIDVDELCP